MTKKQFTRHTAPTDADKRALLQYFTALPANPATLADFDAHWRQVKFTPLSNGELIHILQRIAMAYTRHKDTVFTADRLHTLQKQMFFWQTPFLRTRPDLNAHETNTVISAMHALNLTINDDTLNKLEMAFAGHLPTATTPDIYYACALFLKNRRAMAPQTADALQDKLATLKNLAPFELQKIVAAITAGKGRLSKAAVQVMNQTLSAQGATLNPALAARFLSDVTKARIPLNDTAKSFLENALTAKTNTPLALHSAISALRAYNHIDTPDMTVIQSLDDAIAAGLQTKTDAKSSNYALFVYNQAGFKPSKAVIHAAYKNIGSQISTIPLDIAVRFLRNFSRLGVVPASPLLNTLADRIEKSPDAFALDHNLATEAILACAVLDSIATDPALKRMATTLAKTPLMSTAPIAMRVRMRDACLWFGIAHPLLQQNLRQGDTVSKKENQLRNIFQTSGMDINTYSTRIHALGKHADFAIPRPNTRGYIFVELDGPHHFMRNMDGTTQYNGDTVFQTRLMEKTNPTDLIVRLPHDHLAAASENRTQFQTGKLLDNALSSTRYLGTHRSHALLYKDNRLTLSKM